MVDAGRIPWCVVQSLLLGPRTDRLRFVFWLTGAGLASCLGTWDTHPAWWAGAQKPSHERLWYVAIRRTLQDNINNVPAYYFPEAELRFQLSHLVPSHVTSI